VSVKAFVVGFDCLLGCFELERLLAPQNDGGTDLLVGLGCAQKNPRDRFFTSLLSEDTFSAPA